MDGRKEEENGTGPADTDANVEQVIGDGVSSAEEYPAHDSRVRFGLDQPVRLSFTHYRKRLCDPDGLSVKAAIDGLVLGKVLTNDAAQQITEITHRQVKSGEERTVIEIEEV